jgi:hypothetical protein
LGTLARGSFAMVANATVNIDSCTFTDMDTFVFQSNATVEATTFRRCNSVTLGGALMAGCTITRSTAAVALACGASVSSLSNTSFVSAGTGHAIEITSGTSHTLAGLSFTGYAASNGSTGNESVFVNIASGSVTLNTDSTISYRTAGATVTVVAGQKTLTLTGIVAGSDVVILEAGTDTELANVDANSGSTFAYSYAYAPGTFIDVCVYKAGFVPLAIRNYLLGSESGSLPINQTPDRNYLP